MRVLLLFLLVAASTGVWAATEYMVYTQRALSSLELSTLQLLGVPIEQYYVSKSSSQSVVTVRYENGGGGSTATLQAALANVFGSSSGFTTVLNRDIAARADATRLKHGHAFRADATPSHAPSIVHTDYSTTSWALDRIDQHALPLDSTYNPNNGATGAGVHAYIVDTGVFIAHPDFGGRAVNSFSVINNGDFTDQNGHGTHVAGLVGSNTWGVAKAATLHNVRVLDSSGSGSLSGLAQGLLWVRDHATKPAVINMSLGFYGYDSSLASIIADLVAQGIVVHAAAGNDDESACSHYPSAYPNVVSVGSTDSSDSRSSFSNWGSSCSGGANPVNIMSPGSDVKSTWNDGGTQVLSGTSMATPLVTGASALLFQELNTMDGDLVRQNVIGQCTTGQLHSLSGAPNCLLMVGAAVTSSPTSSRAPSASSSSSSSTSTSTTTTTTSSSSTSSGASGSGDVLSGTTATRYAQPWLLIVAVMVLAPALWIS